MLAQQTAYLPALAAELGAVRIDATRPLADIGDAVVTQTLRGYLDRHRTLLNGLFWANPRRLPAGVDGLMRVLTVTNMYPSADRPVMGTFVAEQVESLRRRGLEVDVLFIDGPGGKQNYLRGVGDVRRATVRPYDLLHAHYVFCGVIALAQRRLPIVLTQHGIEAQQGWTVGLCRWTSRRVAHTIASSPAVADALRLPRVTVIPCGVDADLFRPMPQEAARQALGLPAEAPLVLFVGDPRPEKRLPLLQAAFAQLQTRRPEAQLILVHSEPRERVALYMNACDVLALTSVAEGSPMVVREALACNLPVVSTDVGDVRALLADLPGCFIARPDPGDLADQLAQALAFAARTTGRERILPWSLAAVAEKIEAVYRQVLHAR